MNSALVTIAKFSQTMLWVVGALFVADFAVIMISLVRSGTADKDEGCVVNEALGSDSLDAMKGDAAVTSRYPAKKKVLLSRSSFISDKSLVDGTATKSQRLIVYGIKLAFLLFWLAWVFGLLTLLPSNPAPALLMIVLISIWFFRAVALVRKGRQDALRKLGNP
ncbi:MAG: hypothetical protein WA741_31450 [Candidatus Sulfotelmatobacter sp.]